MVTIGYRFTGTVCSALSGLTGTGNIEIFYCGQTMPPISAGSNSLAVTLPTCFEKIPVVCEAVLLSIATPPPSILLPVVGMAFTGATSSTRI